jgi:hypothetical protein
MIGEYNKHSTHTLKRLTNNYVENYFGNLKVHTLKNKAHSCSELACFMYSRLQAKHELYFEKTEKIEMPRNSKSLKIKGKRLEFYLLIKKYFKKPDYRFL